MPPIVQATDGIDPNAIRVLITGFGPFGKYKENPSWLAVKPLHNTILYTDPPTDLLTPSDQAAMITDEMEEFLRRPQQIHITTLEVPVSYQAVLILPSSAISTQRDSLDATRQHAQDNPRL
ncbi:hypothetical protein NUW54_g6594 [Trametes sanguinea]|uniref:Uncharacterized protein n=1 Tax=Trametes sanguinea TaxID=158606 RepID=A0ACC1PT02_9APHY|nr:hypothetical protein NUW54_g6594 [Trametes sanguinea]